LIDTDLSIGESDVGSVGIAFVLDRFRSILPTLKILSCSKNNMQDIPRIFQQLNDLQSLDLSKNQIENCWNLPYLPKLIALDLSENKLNFFPDFLQKSTLIKILHLNKNEFLRNIPDWIHELPLLKYLDISRTGIESLPVEFKRLTNLRRFCIAHTPLQKKIEGIEEDNRNQNKNRDKTQLLRLDLSTLNFPDSFKKAFYIDGCYEVYL
jgi:Leucine-rich repeat (LRR) protein